MPRHLIDMVDLTATVPTFDFREAAIAYCQWSFRPRVTIAGCVHVRTFAILRVGEIAAGLSRPAEAE